MWASLLRVCASKLDNFQKIAVTVDNLALVRNLYTGLFWVWLPKWVCNVRTGEIRAEIARLESAQADLLGPPGSCCGKSRCGKPPDHRAGTASLPKIALQHPMGPFFADFLFATILLLL